VTALQHRTGGTGTAITGRKSRAGGAAQTVTKLWRRTGGAASLVADWSGVTPVGPQFVAATGHINFATTNAVPAIAAVQSGDILVAFAYGNSQVASVTPPDGTWTLLGSHPVTEPRGWIYTKTATGSLAAGTWTWSGSHNHTVVIGAWRGGLTPTVFATTSPATSVSTINAPTVTTTAANSLLVCFGFHTSAGTTAALAGGMTERRNAGAAVAGSVLADELRATAGATGTRAYTISPGPATLLASSVVIPSA
jgi:hypothetical protein